MIYRNNKRFRKVEEALRFYFRVRELMHSGKPGRLVPGELPLSASLAIANAIDDYQCIGWCMRGLHETELWLLSELYGPTAFGVHRRTFSQACDAGRAEFPEREFRMRQLSLAHRGALGIVKERLRMLGLVPQVCTPAVTRLRRRIRGDQKRLQYQGLQAQP